MSCDICASGSCCASFHSLEEQERFRMVIEAFERARNLRDEVQAQIEEEECDT